MVNSGLLSSHVCFWFVVLVVLVARAAQAVALPPLAGLRMCEEYLQWCEQHPSHLRMVRGHVHKLITVGVGLSADE